MKLFSSSSRRDAACGALAISRAAQTPAFAGQAAGQHPPWLAVPVHDAGGYCALKTMAMSPTKSAAPLFVSLRRGAAAVNEDPLRGIAAEIEADLEFFALCGRDLHVHLKPDIAVAGR